jgi:hypothetical protein
MLPAGGSGPDASSRVDVGHVPHTHRRQLNREFVATGLYLDLVLLAALVVAPEDHLPEAHDIALLILGGSAGLLAAHWLAFRLAVQVTTEGNWHKAASQEVVAQLAGGLGVALLAATPFLVFPATTTALRVSLILLITPLAAAGLVIGRMSGRSWVASAALAGLALAVAAVVVTLKIRAGSH